MIPTIEQVIEDLLAGSITKSQAVTWLHEHAASAHADLRDHFAGLAFPIAWDAYDKGYTGGEDRDTADMCNHAYQIADAMINERNK